MAHSLIVELNQGVVEKLKNSYTDVYEVGKYYVVLLPYAVVSIRKDERYAAIYSDTIQDIYTAVAFLKTLKIDVKPVRLITIREGEIDWPKGEGE